MTLALKRRFPKQWVLELRDAVDSMGLPYQLSGLDKENSSVAAVEFLITAHQDEVPKLNEWLAAHGDEDAARIFGAKRHQWEGPRKVLTLGAGESSEAEASSLTPELTGMILDPTSISHESDELQFSGSVRRLIPKSGIFGRFGLYRVDIKVGQVSAFELQDLLVEDSLAVEYVHYDPSCHRFAIGSPIHGALVATTPSSGISVSIADKPHAVRRWRRFSPA